MQGDVLFGQRSHAIGEQIDRRLLPGDHRLHVAHRGIERGAEAVRQRGQALDPLAALVQRGFGLLDARHDVAQLGDQRVVRGGNRTFARHMQPVVADLRLGELDVDVTDEARADRDFLHQAVLLGVDLLQVGQLAFRLRRSSAGGEAKRERRECVRKLSHCNDSPIK